MRFSDLFKNFTSFTFAMVPKNSKFMQKLTISKFGKKWTGTYTLGPLTFFRTQKEVVI